MFLNRELYRSVQLSVLEFSEWEIDTTASKFFTHWDSEQLTFTLQVFLLCNTLYPLTNSRNNSRHELTLTLQVLFISTSLLFFITLKPKVE